MPKELLLSVIVPAYNEEKTILQLLKAVAAVSVFKEIIVVNDASKDNTKELIVDFKRSFADNRSNFPYLSRLQLIDKSVNHGKGAAIRSALGLVDGDVVLIQDADLELDPYEYPKLMTPFAAHSAAVVFGSRFRHEGLIRVHPTGHFLGNKFLTWVSNFLSGLYLTDIETCYKVFKKELICSFNIRSNRFGIDPELTAKTARAVKSQTLNFYEVPISYNPRTYAHGKKIKTFKDGLVVLWSIIYFNWLNCKQ